MSFDLGHIWTHMGPLAKVIAGVLLMMAIACVGVAVERWIVLTASARQSRRFAPLAAAAINDWRLDDLVRLCQDKRYRLSALARLFQPITTRYLEARAGNVSPVELARNESARTLEALGADLRRGLSVLASTGSVAPFVGLLGTVIGIIGAFQGIASTGSGGLSAVSAGISEALIETAFGLLVAIPAVLLFNYLTTRIAAVELTLGRSAGDLLDELENRHVWSDPKTKTTRQSAEQAA